MTVLVTGSSGFVGRAIMARLAGRRDRARSGRGARHAGRRRPVGPRAAARPDPARGDHAHHPCGRRVRPDGAGGRSGRRDRDQRHRQHEPAVRGDGRRRRDLRLLLLGRGDRRLLRARADRRGLSDAARLDLWLLQGRDGLRAARPVAKSAARPLLAAAHRGVRTRPADRVQRRHDRARRARRPSRRGSPRRPTGPTSMSTTPPMPRSPRALRRGAGSFPISSRIPSA